MPLRRWTMLSCPKPPARLAPYPLVSRVSLAPTRRGTLCMEPPAPAWPRRRPHHPPLSAGWHAGEHRQYIHQADGLATRAMVMGALLTLLYRLVRVAQRPQDLAISGAAAWLEGLRRLRKVCRSVDGRGRRGRPPRSRWGRAESEGAPSRDKVTSPVCGGPSRHRKASC